MYYKEQRAKQPTQANLSRQWSSKYFLRRQSRESVAIEHLRSLLWRGIVDRLAVTSFIAAAQSGTVL